MAALPGWRAGGYVAASESENPILFKSNLLKRMSFIPVEHADGLPLPQRNWAILTIALGIVMAVVDGSIANVALPTIATDLKASPAFSIWIVNGYQFAITISLLPLASLGEIIGYRRVYLAGLLLFTIASAFCASSHTLKTPVGPSASSSRSTDSPSSRTTSTSAPLRLCRWRA